jgi:hypothetical protein
VASPWIQASLACALVVALHPPVSAADWLFDASPEGWRIGLGPVAAASVGGDSTQLSVPAWRNGALIILGNPVPEIFMDSAGYVRRGTALEQRLLSPPLSPAETPVDGCRVRMRGPAGRSVSIALEWMTAQALDAMARGKRSGAATPEDMASAVTRAHRLRDTAGRIWPDSSTSLRPPANARHGMLSGQVAQEWWGLEQSMRGQPLTVVLTGGWDSAVLPLPVVNTPQPQVVRFGLSFRTALHLPGPERQPPSGSWLLDVGSIEALGGTALPHGAGAR